MIKLLYIANENIKGDQVGPRQAFDKMVNNNELKEYKVVPFLFLLKRLKSQKEVNNEIERVYKEFRPDIVLIEHLNKFYLSKEVLMRFKEINNKVIISYREGDLYKGIAKPIPKSIKNIAKYVDVAFICGEGKYKYIFENIGFKTVLFSPNCVDTIRFCKTSVKNKEFDLIFIGNNVKKRMKIFDMEGTRERKDIIKFLSDEFGDRFALYGEGWEGVPSWRGKLDFNLQTTEISKSKIVIGIDHYPSISKYFSNRLPIGLISGTPYLAYKSRDIDILFEEGKEIFFFENKTDLAKKIKSILSLKDAELNCIANNAYKK